MSILADRKLEETGRAKWVAEELEILMDPGHLCG